MYLKSRNAAKEYDNDIIDKKIQVGSVISIDVEEAKHPKWNVILEITNGGAFAVTWPGAIAWDSDTAPEMQTSGVDIITLITTNGGTAWRGIHTWKEA